MSDAAFTRRVLIALGMATLAGFAVTLVVFAIDVLLLSFAGVLVALFLRGLAGLVRRHTRLGEMAALWAVVVALVAAVALAGWLVAPSLVEQAGQLTEQLPRALTQLHDRLTNWGRLILAYAPDPAALARSLLIGRFGGTVAATLGWIVGGTANLAVILFVGLYVAVSPDVYRRGVLRLVPAAGRPRARAVMDRLRVVLQRWLAGKAIGMLVIGTCTSAGLALVGVPAALALGLVAGLLNFIPYLGPVLSFLPAALLAMTQSTAMFGWVLIVYVVIQVLESYVVTPLVQQEAVALPSALIITAQVLLGVAVGWLGLLLATPLTACVVVLVTQLYLDERERPADAARPDRAAAA